LIISRALKSLKYNPKTAYPMVSALRVQKYLDKGYTISKLEMMRIITSVSAISLTSWEEAEDHLGGMYGQTITQITKDVGDFSIEALLEILGKEEYREQSLVQHADTALTLEKVIKHLNIPDLEEQEETLRKEKEKKFGGSYYKRIGQDFKSTNNPSNVKAIEYKEGEVVNGGRNGIYCRKWNRLHEVAAEYKGPYFVVMKPANEECKWNGSALVGDVYVEKIIPWTGCEALNYKSECKIDVLNMLEAKDANSSE
jgi:hypothetical protein